MELASQEEQLRDYYRVLFRSWGRQHWWPARTRFEVIAGAYLTQNTAWTNVEKALRQLRAAGALSLQGIRRTPLSKLERLIRPAGYFRQKSRRLKEFVRFVDKCYEGSLTQMFARPTHELRRELLTLNGVGPETADSILLYAGNHPVFVVDAYTRRILERHAILPANSPYEQIRELFEGALRQANWRGHDFSPAQSLASQPRALAPGGPPETISRRLRTAVDGASHLPSSMSTARRSPLAQTYNEMHGLIVGVGKNYCLKRNPLCEQCPLRPFLPRAQHGRAEV